MKQSMIANILILTLVGSMIFNQCTHSQPDTIDYFGQEVPGNIPEKFSPGFISLDNRYEFKPLFSPDGNEFYITISNPPAWSYSKTMVSKYVNKVWTEPVEVDLGGDVLDWGHCFSADGDTLYFNSCSSNWILDIYFVVRTDAGWSEATKISNTVNSIGSGIANSISGNSTLYFRSTQSQQLGVGPKPDIFYSKRENKSYQSPTKMDIPINSGGNENCPIIATDESFLIFTTDRYLNDNDICISYAKDDGTWTNPKVFIENAQSGSITPDNKYLLFYTFSNSGSTQTDIYWVKIGEMIDSLRQTNFSPYILDSIHDQSVDINDFYSYSIPDSLFFDDDGNETLSLTVTTETNKKLPESISFDSTANIIKGKLANVGSYNIKVTATDTEGASISDVYILTVE